MPQNQNDYIILFDEDGSPYIAHASWQDVKNAVSNAASSVANTVKGVGRGVRKNHTYLLKVDENGRTRYFYTQEEIDAYRTNKNKPSNPQIPERNRVTNAVASAANNARNAVTNTVNSVQNNMAQRAEARQQRREEKQQQAQAKQDQKTREASVSEYETRRQNGFKEGSNSIFSRTKKNSSYNEDSMRERVNVALQQDNIYNYDGDDPKIKSAKRDVVMRRQQYEEHSMDLAIAQNQYTVAKDDAQKAYEAYMYIMEDKTSSSEARKAAKKALEEQNKVVKQYEHDMFKLNQLLQKDHDAYKSAIQVYNMHLHINGLI